MFLLLHKHRKTKYVRCDKVPDEVVAEARVIGEAE